MNIHIIYLAVLTNICFGDFYVGMFKDNDLLVAQDRLYKERVPYRSVYAKYGRIFKCQITYFRIVDRLGIGRGPGVEIIRGGLRKKYLVLRLKSQYNNPISVNIYVGCENKMPARTVSYSKTKSTITTMPTTTSTTSTTFTTTTANTTTTPTNATTTLTNTTTTPTNTTTTTTTTTSPTNTTTTPTNTTTTTTTTSPTNTTTTPTNTPDSSNSI